jgi:Protein of unknown function (DUF2735)
MMNTDLDQGSAKIYQFPAGGRAALGGRRYDETIAMEAAASQINVADCSGSWYHASAIEEAKRDH